MKKSVVALLVTSVMAAGSAQAVQVFANDTAQLDVYGSLRLAVEYADNRDAGEDDLQLIDDSTRVGIKGKQSFNDTFYGLGQFEWGFDTQKLDDFKIGNRLAFVGLGGNFGEVTVGKQWAWFDELGVHDFSYSLGGISKVQSDAFGTNRPTDYVKYGIEVQGFTLGLGYAFERKVKSVALEVGNGARELVLADGLDGTTDSGYEVFLAFDGVENLHIGTVYNQTAFKGSADAQATSFGIDAAYVFGAFEVGAMYSFYELEGNAVKAATNGYGLGAKYAINDQVNVYAGYDVLSGKDALADAGIANTVVGIDYNFASQVVTFLEYANANYEQGSDDNIALLGLRYSF